MDIPKTTSADVSSCGYNFIKSRGSGSYGLVHEVKDEKDNLFALKHVKQDPLYPTLGLDCLIEIDILNRFSHPYIIHCHRVVTPNMANIEGVAILLPLAERTLFNMLKYNTMTIPDKILLIYKIITAVNFLHTNKVLHLDIKSENILISGYDNKTLHPYLIDFGLSLFADNIYTGVSDIRERITLDYRPPELIIPDKKIYNYSSDVWSLGVLCLEIIIGEKLETHICDTDQDLLRQSILQYFTYENIVQHLSIIEYNNDLVDLISSMLNPDPKFRPTTDEILHHNIFSHIEIDIESSSIIMPTPYDYADDQIDLIRLIRHLCVKYMSNSSIELLFLSIDLFYRSASFFKDDTVKTRTTLAAACIWIADKLINPEFIILDNLVKFYSEEIPGLTSKDILEHEYNLIDILHGVFYPSRLYAECKNKYHLIQSYETIIRSKDPMLYPRVDVELWIQQLDLQVQPPISSKTITIGDFLQ